MTTNPTAAIAEALSALDAAWVAAGGSAGGRVAGDAQSVIEGMTDSGLLAVNDAIALVRRRVDALHVRVAAGIADRSRPELGSEGLARKAGHRTPVKLIAAVTGGHAGDAARLIEVGRATTGGVTFSGERTPPRHPHVQAALHAGAVSIAASAAISGLLDKLALRVARDDLDAAEATLVQRAPLLALDELHALLRRVEAHLDPDGLEPHLEELHAKRGLWITQRANGAVHLDGDFDPETAAPIVAAIDALVTHMLRTSRGHNHPDTAHADAAAPPGTTACASAAESTDLDGGAAAAGGNEARVVREETRTLPQLRADALAMLCRHTLGCTRSGSALAHTTVIVRVPLDALTTGTGTIDGITQPIDAGTARRLAATAEIIPIVLGAESEVLDLGRASRVFTRAQRLALAERDGGCASCGLPSSYAEAHHLTWWSHDGPTDLRNGILLCTACHHRIHNEGWEIRIDPPPGSRDATAGTVWFIPPAHIDPERAPRLGGRARFDGARAA
ncbi:MAG: DUF222 domain-containing protein [Microbacterium sp.]